MASDPGGVEPADRVRAALAVERERPDRPPVGLWGHSFLDEWSPRRLAAAAVAAQRRYGWDFVKLQPRATCFAEALGSRYRPSGDRLARPVLERQAVEGVADWERIATADPAALVASPPLADQVETVGRVASELGPSIPVIQTVFSPLTVAGYLVGEDGERAVRELRDHGDVVAPALDRIAATLAAFIARSVEASAAGVFFAISGYASADLIDEEEYRRLALPSDLRVLGSIPAVAWLNVAHLCGRRIHFDLVRELPVHAVSWSVHQAGNPGLAEGRERSGRAVMGGLDQTGALVTGPPEAVAAEAVAAIGATEGRGVLIAPGCSVPPEAPDDHVAAAATAVRAYT